MLLGRRPGSCSRRLWPARADPFSARMNAVPKLVASRTLTDTSAWANSGSIAGDLARGRDERDQRDVIVTGSLSVVHALMAADLVDEYRLLTFPYPRWARGSALSVGGPPRVPVGRTGRRRRPHPVRPPASVTSRFRQPAIAAASGTTTT